MSLFTTIKSRIGFIFRKLTFSPIKYWEERALKYGERSVLNLSHSADELKAVKALQIETIFPLLKKELRGDEKNLLDFGCGPGRFCIDLADLTGCTVIGVDPIEHLLQLAPKSPKVSYKKLITNKIPTENKSFDIIWVCLVLGGVVSQKELKQIAGEIRRVAKDNCLLFLIENTTDKKNNISWHYRSIETYINLFKEFNLAYLKSYEDANEFNSIFAGRKT